MARRPRRPRGSQAPQNAPGGGFGSLGIEPYFTARSAGRLADRGLEVGGSYAGAALGGQPFSLGNNAESIGALIGGILGIPFGAPGMMAGSAVGGGIGGFFQSTFQAVMGLHMSSGMASAQTGFPTTANPNGLVPWMSALAMGTMGNPTLQLAASGIQNLPDALNPGQPIGTTQAYFALGALGQSNAGSPLNPLQNATALGAEATSLIQRFGSPMFNGQPNPAFAYAASQMAPVLNDPLLNPGFAKSLAFGTGVGRDDLQASILEVGGPAAYRAINVAGNNADRASFGSINYQMARRGIESQIQSVGSGSASTVLQEALMEGNRTDAISDFSSFFSAEDANIGALTNQRALYNPNSRNPIVRREYTNLSNQITMAQTQERAGRFQQGTLGPDPTTATATGRISTAIEMIESSPFGLAVPIGLRQNLIGLYGNRLGQLDAQVAAMTDPTQRAAAQARNEPERDQLMLLRQEQRNALLTGEFGNILDISTNPAGGVNFFGAGNRSLGGYQRANPGGNRGLGGSGRGVSYSHDVTEALGSIAGSMGMGNGPDSEIKNILGQIRDLLKSGGGGSMNAANPSGAMNNKPIDQVKNRGNGMIGAGLSR